ncbi:MAG: hypothetical protein ABIQ93_00370 [Saprospiraceae bacterium]
MERTAQPALTMPSDEILFHKIEDYLRGRLSSQDSAAFESELASDAGLAALVHRQRQENEALGLLNERDLRARMQAWERQAPPVMAPIRGQRLVWMRWAAAAMVVVAAGWWLFRQWSPVEAPGTVKIETPGETPKIATRPHAKPKPKTTPARPERRTDPTPPKEVIADAPKTNPEAAKRSLDYAAIADEYYRENDFFSGPASTGKGAADYDRALRDFRNGRYSDLVPQLRPGGKMAATDIKTKELLAHSLLKNRQYDAAIAAFREIANGRQQPYADRAEWALSLAYLRQMPRRTNELDQMLRSITARPGHTFYARAKMLRARLGNG